MRFELTILGSSGAVPFKDRYMTAQVLEACEQLFLIDCGEGTQMRMSEFRVRRSRIEHIFISHLHGDHVFGLPGLVTSLALNMREKPLHIYGPAGLEGMINGMFPYGKKSNYFDIIYHPVDTTQHRVVYEGHRVEVSSVPLDHGVPCCGYLFREKPLPLKMRKDKIQEYDIPVMDIPAIKAGNDWTAPDGRIVPNAELTSEPLKPRSFAFCSDTKYNERILPYIQNVDLLYHESSFLHRDLDRALATNHTTALQAARMALKANAGRLVLGHYSARYESLDGHLEEARAVFPDSYLGRDGDVFEVAAE